jgi:hypothetical protein
MKTSKRTRTISKMKMMNTLEDRILLPIIAKTIEEEEVEEEEASSISRMIKKITTLKSQTTKEAGPIMVRDRDMKMEIVREKSSLRQEGLIEAEGLTVEEEEALRTSATNKKTRENMNRSRGEILGHKCC